MNKFNRALIPCVAFGYQRIPFSEFTSTIPRSPLYGVCTLQGLCEIDQLNIYKLHWCRIIFFWTALICHDILGQPSYIATLICFRLCSCWGLNRIGWCLMAWPCSGPPRFNRCIILAPACSFRIYSSCCIRWAAFYVCGFSLIFHIFFLINLVQLKFSVVWWKWILFSFYNIIVQIIYSCPMEYQWARFYDNW